jgi:hypothetical protein
MGTKNPLDCRKPTAFLSHVPALAFLPVKEDKTKKFSICRCKDICMHLYDFFTYLFIYACIFLKLYNTASGNKIFVWLKRTKEN